VISLEDWALIRHLHRSEGLSQRAIARQLNIARDTVAAAVASDGPRKYERETAASAINVVEPRMRAILSAYPTMPATVIAERVGWTGSMSWFRERVRAIRPEYLPANPIDRLAHPPGRVIQCDLWFPAPKIAVGFGQEAMLPMLVKVAAFSRFIAAVMLPSRQTMDLVAGMWQLLSDNFAAVPHELWWDNEAGIGRRGRLTDPVTALMGTLGSRLVQLKPYDPESKRASWSEPTATWRRRFFLGAASPRRRTSMLTGSMAPDRKPSSGAGPRRTPGRLPRLRSSPDAGPAARGTGH
jgi:hypothetical protein